MKLAIVGGSLHRGGAERVMLYLAQCAHNEGVDVSLVTFGRHSIEYSLPDCIKRYVVSDVKKNRIIGLRRIIKELDADVVLVMGTSNTMYVMPALIGLHIPIVISERNSPANFEGSKINMFFSRLLMKKADGFVFQTQEAKDFYRKRLHDRGIVIPNPLFLDNFPEPYYGKREKRVVSVGRLANQKNHIMLLRAAKLFIKKHSDYIIEIYGEGPLRKKLEKYIDDNKLNENVFLKGNVQSVAERIRNSSIFVMCSIYEGMPNALIESLALGLPSISTDCPCGGPRELIDNNNNGILIKVNDYIELFEKMDELASNPSFSDRIGKAAVGIRNTLNSKIIFSKWLDYLYSFVGEK